MSASDVARSAYWRLRGHYRPLPAAFADALHDAAVLEIGGPTALFGAAGMVPVYPAAACVDNVQFDATTAWHALNPEDASFAPDGVARGRQFFADDIALSFLADDSYDAVISSHVIEHFANPLRALEAWHRVLRPDGLMLIVAPHHEGTFDRRRPVTSIEHMIEDRDRNTDEDDLTHLDETLRLHDFSRDVPPDDRERWEAARRDNARTRLLHHHVFTTHSLLELLATAGFRAIEHTTRYPHDIYALCRVEPTRAIPSALPTRIDCGPFSA